MSRFDNKLCPVCRRPLTDKSDIVVCPECGTPHHRACYLSLGHCGVQEYHASGFEWKGFLPGEEPQEPQQEVSPENDEQTIGEPESEFSRDHRAEYPGGTDYGSGTRDGSQDGFGQPMDIEEYLRNLQRQTMDDTRGADGVSSRELSTFVGRSVMHYSQAFASFRAPVLPGQKRRKAFINLCAGFFAPIHQFYRRMDLLGAIMVLVEFLFYIPPLLLNAGIGTADVLANLQLVARGISFVAVILLCVFGDYLYYRYAVKRIRKIREKYDDGRADGYYEALAAKGTPSWLRAIVASLIVSILMTLVLMNVGISISSGTV